MQQRPSLPGYEVYSSADYKNAAAIYQKLLKDYPTDPIVPAAQLQLAFCFYFLGQFDEALNILKKAESGPAMSAELKQTLDGLVPQILSGKAAAIPAADPKRNSTFEEATAKFTEYINKYPQASDLENVIFGRAIAEYQLRKFDDAVKDLELNLQKFPQSSTLAKSKHLLAVTLATQGSALLVTGDPAAKTKAFDLYKRATDYPSRDYQEEGRCRPHQRGKFSARRDSSQPRSLQSRIGAPRTLRRSVGRFPGGSAEGGNHRACSKTKFGNSSPRKRPPCAPIMPP